jgi:hypothetical protein
MSNIPEVLAIRVLTRIAEDPQLLGRLLEKVGSMPNILTPTMGGHVFWIDIASVNGWRFQKNQVFGNCRIIDPNNIRRAWGGQTAMLKAFQTLE